MGKIIDMTGKTCGELTVLKMAPKNPAIKSRNTHWICKCSCGNIVTVDGCNLRNGNTKSCGCLQKKIASQTHSSNLVGKKFGKLLVVAKTEQRASNHHIIYECRCDCGNIHFAISDNLTKGLTKSCGCNKYQSYGVQIIKQLLTENNIPFKMEVVKKIQDTAYFWDFVIYPNNEQKTWFIEYDGKQHFKSGSETGWNTKANLIKTHKRDMIKNNYSFVNNIPLIRIPYNTDKITIDMLKPNTSQYILTKENVDKYYKDNGYQEEDKYELV